MDTSTARPAGKKGWTPAKPIEPPALASPAGRSRWLGWLNGPVVLILAATALAGGLRFYHLSTPSTYVFDEVYYAKDACFDAGYPYRRCNLDDPGEQTANVHPPLGREILSLGVRMFGNDPFGWRVGSAAFGTVSVLLTAILAYLMFGTGTWAGVAGLLLATEALNFVQSRMSMLDILLATFVIAGFLFLVLDRRWIERRTPPTDHVESDETGVASIPRGGPPSPLFRPWLLVAGLAFGAAVATKWSGAPALLGGVVLALAWERSRRTRYGLEHPTWEALRFEGFGIFVFLVVVPILVYVATYARWFLDHGVDVSGWLELQKGMATYSIELRAEHPYASRPWQWPLMIRPVSYFYEGGAKAGTSSEILGMGHPLVFWASIPALLWAAVAGWRRRDWRAGVVLTGFLSQYVPWWFAARTSFLFYMTPMTTFMVLACTYGLKDMWDTEIGEDRTRSLRPLVVALVILAVAMFAFFFPILTGRTIPYRSWQQRMWFRSWI